MDGEPSPHVEEKDNSTIAATQHDTNHTILTQIYNDQVGDQHPITTPFGVKKLTYCDWTASGRGSKTIQSYIANEVLPLYGNTHSVGSATGLQTTCFRNEAREIIQLACNAHRTNDVVIFTGSGTTGAINRLVHVLNLANLPEQPVVFIGPWEHHSNLLPWRESGALVVPIPESHTGHGGADLEVLRAELRRYASRKVKLGAFSAASNVTGFLEDVEAVTALLHKHGALSFWDYATAGPYVRIDMNPVSVADEANRAFVQKDAVFFSPHKFPGGAGGTPGVLIAKKFLFDNQHPPYNPGGGTVFFVSSSTHRFLESHVEREEGGTPDIVGSIRAGLVMKLKQSVGHQVIMDAEDAIVKRAFEVWSDVPELHVLGGALQQYREQQQHPHRHQLAIFSFLISVPGTNKFLNHNFVACVLNDLYGIQTRGGCMCAGPYVQRLLGMSASQVDALESRLVGSTHAVEHLRPGATRLSLAYFIPKPQLEFVLQAVKDVAKMGWKLLPLYKFDTRTGDWGHKIGFQKYTQRKWLSNFNMFGNKPSSVAVEEKEQDLIPQDAQACLEEARQIMEQAQLTQRVPHDEESLRWFLTPFEAQNAQGDDELFGSSPDAREANPLVDPRLYVNGEVIENTVVPASCDNLGSECFSCVPNAIGAGEGGSTCNNIIDTSCAVLPDSLPVPMLISPTSIVTKREKRQPKRQFSIDLASSARAIGRPLARALSSTCILEDTSAKLSTDITLFNLRPTPPTKLLKLVARASKEWDMIRPGDRLLLGLSGGKDSLSLLHILLEIQKCAPFPFEIAACTIDPGTAAFDPSPLIPYMASLGVKYHYERTTIFDNAKAILPAGSQSYCSFCARMKRGTLYRVVKENGYTALVLAQHLDDFVESFWMSATRNGQLRTMKANYVDQMGNVRVIRPLVHVRERDTKAFAFAAKLPVINENCPACFAAPSERARVKELLKQEEVVSPNMFDCFRRALSGLMDEGMQVMLDDFTEGLKSKAMNGGRQSVSKPLPVAAVAAVAVEDTVISADMAGDN